jgi:hypothetical protein
METVILCDRWPEGHLKPWDTNRNSPYMDIAILMTAKNKKQKKKRKKEI